MVIIAELSLKSTEDGGFNKPLYNGGAGNWNIHAGKRHVELSSGPINILGADFVRPGDSATIIIRPMFPEQWTHVRVGAQLELHSGVKVRGRARVSEVLLPR